MRGKESTSRKEKKKENNGKRKVKDDVKAKKEDITKIITIEGK